MSCLFRSILFLCVTLTTTTPWNAAGQASLITLLTNGPTAVRLNIVFLSEGYTTNELSRFPADAQVMLNRILLSAPLNEYSNYFNAFAISVPSNESGSDHYTPTVTLVDTYFNSRYDTSGIQRLITVDSTGRSRVFSLLAEFVPEYDLVAIVVNDAQYGGSGGSLLVSSINSQSPEIAAHEMGHTFANLGDEYSDAGGTPTERPNTTAQTNLAAIKWKAWIPPGTPIPTPEADPYLNTVGLFRGAAYSSDYFRPKNNCKMRSLGVAFCEVCSETFVKSIYNKLGMIEAHSPATNILLGLTNSITETFSLSTLTPSSHTLSIQWFTNNVAVPGATSPEFSIGRFDLPLTGINLVRAEVSDLTPLVLSPPTNMMKHSLTWRSMFVPPDLVIRQNASETIITWPPAAFSYVLETTESLDAAANWTPVFTISNQNGFIVAPTNPHTFYRLHRP